MSRSAQNRGQLMPGDLNNPRGDAVDTFIRREDAEQFIATVELDDPYVASHLRVVERELEAGGPN